MSGKPSDFVSGQEDLIRDQRPVQVLSDLALEDRLKALQERRANPPKRIDNTKLWAGSSMYLYCDSCRWMRYVVSESYDPRDYSRLCKECQSLQKMGQLPEVPVAG